MVMSSEVPRLENFVKGPKFTVFQKSLGLLLDEVVHALSALGIVDWKPKRKRAPWEL